MAEEILNGGGQAGHRLSTRDYFAAAALQGLISKCQAGPPNLFAKSAFDMADAMMLERLRPSALVSKIKTDD